MDIIRLDVTGGSTTTYHGGDHGAEGNYQA